MTVKEYIEYLKTLDQDKGIWISYDCACSVFPPIPDYQMNYENESYVTIPSYKEAGVEEGDYIIDATV